MEKVRWVGPITFIAGAHDPARQADSDWEKWGGPAQPSFRGHAPRWIFEVHAQPDGSFATWSGRAVRVRDGRCWVGLPMRPSLLAVQIAHQIREMGGTPEGMLPGEETGGSSWADTGYHARTLTLDGVTLTVVLNEREKFRVHSNFAPGTRAHRNAVEAVWSRWAGVVDGLPTHPALVRGW